MNPSPLVHVLIINWNGLEHLQDCFESLLSSPYSNAKFILLDNATDDDSVAYVREHFGNDPRVDFRLLDENLGWSRANNEGMKAALDAGADYVLLLNNDTRVEPDFLDKLVEHAESDPEIGALSPRILMFDDSQIINSVGLEASIIGSGWDRGIGRIDSLEWDSNEAILGVCGAAMFLRTSALQESGLLPDDFEIYLDDLDLCLRIWNSGYTIKLCYASVVHHKFSATMGEGKRARHKYYLNTRNRSRIVLRNFPSNQLLRALLTIDFAEAKAVGRAILDGDLWKIPLHLRSWIDFFLYIPKAISHRRTHHPRTASQDLIRNRPLFFPGVVFPENGWYPPIDIDGAEYRPMAKTAEYEHTGGKLRIRIANPHKNVAHTEISITHSDDTIATLDDEKFSHAEFDVLAGTITFRANAIISAEQSGLLHDVGGWISIETDSRNIA
ncbi:MAG TPA: glycosyltransferase family 2 protein [Candidatus Hydrogenedentes bacterium]|nr:glycosyltransferase family 2 protein [Candidatus Hydrogenedentota bacterium]